MSSNLRLPEHVARRVRQVTPRQAVAFATVAALGGGVIVSAATGRQSLATALLGLLAVLLFVAIVQLRRRLAQEAGALRAQIAAVQEHVLAARSQHHAELHDLTERVDFGQRRISAAVENERLAAADFRGEILAVIEAAKAARG